MLPPVVPAATATALSGAVLADVRWYLDGRAGRAAFESGHLPGAVFVDLDRWLAGPPGAAAGRHPLPDPDVFAEGMSRAGIADDTPVLGYDDVGGAVAARLVWMLRATGHDAALLDGGLQAWDGPLATGAGPVVESGAFSARPWPTERLADIDDAAGGSSIVIDARDPQRYRGDVEPVDRRAGHIPGARSVPFRSLLDTDLRLLPVVDLYDRFVSAGVRGDADVVVYCGSGVNACHVMLALEQAGFAPGRLYAGSWSQYSATDRPAATGDDGPGDDGPGDDGPSDDISGRHRAGAP